MKIEEQYSNLEIRSINCLRFIVLSMKSRFSEKAPPQNIHTNACFPLMILIGAGYVAARYQPNNRELKQNNIQCFYPLIDALEEVYQSYPNATFLFVVRETESWLKSMQSFQDGFIIDLWRRCRTRGFPGLNSTLSDFRDFYEWHKGMIRAFAEDHPSLTYIEVELESPDTGHILQDRVGIDASCWGHYNQQKQGQTPR